ncbi:MAG: SH3 domain-containing protein, partial [Albidovulum sp.]
RDWCRISASGERGWVLKSELWGVDPEELRD